MNIAMMLFFLDRKLNHEFGNRTIKCIAFLVKIRLNRNRSPWQEQWFWSWVFEVCERSRKPVAEKSRFENVQFLSWRTFFVGKYDIQSTNEITFKRTVTLREFSIFPPSDLMRPRYCRSADARMRMQNALLLLICRLRWFPKLTVGS